MNKKPEPGEALNAKEAQEELKRLKTEHQLILGAAGEGIYGLDCGGRATFVNSAATELLGWREQDVLGEPLHDIHHHSHPDGSHYPRISGGGGAAELLGLKPSTLSYRMKVLKIEKLK